VFFFTCSVRVVSSFNETLEVVGIVLGVDGDLGRDPIALFGGDQQRHRLHPGQHGQEQVQRSATRVCPWQDRRAGRSPSS